MYIFLVSLWWLSILDVTIILHVVQQMVLPFTNPTETCVEHNVFPFIPVFFVRIPLCLYEQPSRPFYMLYCKRMSRVDTSRDSPPTQSLAADIGTHLRTFTTVMCPRTAEISSAVSP